MNDWQWILLFGALAIVVWIITSRRNVRRQTLSRLYGGYDEELASMPLLGENAGALRRWLYVAGFRSALAPFWFLMAQGLVILMAVVIGWALVRSNLAVQAQEWALEIPGAAGELIAPILQFGPLIVVSIIIFIPLLVVRSRRRTIVQQVEQELPLSLELLATLSEAGLGFDASIDRLQSQRAADSTPLTREIQALQREMLAGVGRVRCLRRFAWRLDVPSITTFVSAIVQAEQVGAGVSSVFAPTG